MIPLPALPLPKIQRGLDVYHARSFGRWFGIILVATFVMPGSGPGWFSNFGGTMWALIGGGGLIALSFIKSPALKLGHYFFAAAGVGALGILWGGAAASYFWPLNLFGMLGIVGVSVASFMWLRNGWSSQIWLWLIIGASGLGAGLIVPLGVFGGIPLINIFTFIGKDGVFIVARILMTVLSLGFLALVVNWVLQVFLKKENADPEQVERHALVFFFYPLLMLFLIGFFSFFGMFADMLKAMVTSGIYMWLAIWGIVCALELKEKGELKDLMTTSY